MTEESPSYLPQIQPEALRLADLLLLPGIFPDSVLHGAGNELRRLHAENQALQTGYDASRLEVESLKGRVDEVGRIARENRSRAVVELVQEVRVLQAALAEEYAGRSQKDFAIECYEKDIAVIAAAVPADKYDSKDWREGCTRERIEWLHDMYQSTKAENLHMLTALADAHEEIDSLQARANELEAMLDAVGAGGVEPLRRAKCLHRIQEPLPTALVPHETP